jgi:hypothetical protein
MTSNESQDFNPALNVQNDSAQIRRKLAWRMGIAGLMIVALLGGLSLFDYLASDMEETEPPSPGFTEPVPVSKKSVTEASGPVVQAPAPESVPDEEKEEKPVVSTSESSEAPSDAITASPPANNAIPSPAAPTVAANPPPANTAAAAATLPRTPTIRQPSRSTTVRPSASASTPTPASTPSGWTDQRGSPPELAVSRPDASRKVDESPVQIIPRQPPVLSRLLSSGYTFQAGVFVDQQRAEDVYAKLVLEGIPATLETRVLVGPFKNRNEAESARAKMKALGIDALPIPRSGKK